MSLTEDTISVGPGAVLYDVREPGKRPCCSEGGRCLAHVTSVYEDVETGEKLYEVWDGTHTTRQYVLEDDLLAEGMFEPAGWSMLNMEKPTYYLTREVGVYDSHDLMLEANR